MKEYLRLERAFGSHLVKIALNGSPVLQWISSCLVWCNRIYFLPSSKLLTKTWHSISFSINSLGMLVIVSRQWNFKLLITRLPTWWSSQFSTSLSVHPSSLYVFSMASNNKMGDHAKGLHPLVFSLSFRFLVNPLEREARESHSRCLVFVS